MSLSMKEVEKELRETLEPLEPDALRQHLQDLGYEPDKRVGKAKLIEAIVKAEKERIAEAGKTTAKAAKKQLQKGENPLRIEFQNLQNPGKDIEFDFGLPHPTRKKKNGKPVVVMSHYHLFHGQVYDLPPAVVKHLHKLQYYDAEAIEIGGQVRSRRVARRRCNCIRIEDLQ